MAKKEVNIKMKSDTTSAEKGIDKVTSSLNKLSKNKALTSLSKLGGAAYGVKSAFSVVTTTVKAVSSAIKETTDLYQKQIAAEKSLEVAAKNNPYLNASNVKELKNYASYLQSISTVGDEELLPMMAELAAAGRTQEEIQQIMKASLDLSASGMMSLDAAVKQLNKTYSGSVGRLGEQIAGLKNLTKEQLSSGEAVKIIQQRYEGMAQEIAEASGTSQQLKNAWGDLKEEIGASFEENFIPMRQFFTELVGGWASAKKAKREYKEESEAIVNGTAEANEENLAIYQAQVNELQTQKNKLESSIRTNLKGMGYTESEIKRELEGNSEFVRVTEQLAKARENLKKKTDELKEIEEERQRAAKEASDNEAAALAQAKVNARDKLREQYDETIRQAQAEIEQRRNLGEKITEQEEAQQMLNTATSAYVKMMSSPEFIGNSGNYDHEVKAREQIAKWAEKTGKAIAEVEKLLEKAQDFIGKSDEALLSDQIDLTIKALNEEAKSVKDNEEVYAQYVEKVKALEKLKTDVVKEETKKQKEESINSAKEITSNISSYVSMFSQIVSEITELLSENLDSAISSQESRLKEQYENGTISYDEFLKEKEKLDRQSAQKTYTLQMWQWTASMLQAAANVAQGVTAALALPPPASYINAALTTALGAAQIATLAASKPKRPSFEVGGIVPGQSYTGDNIQANVNSGEMVLTLAQQKELWSLANGGKNGGVSVNMPVSIENNSGANVDARMTEEGLKVFINETIKSSLQGGDLNTSLQIANTKARGVRVL